MMGAYLPWVLDAFDAWASGKTFKALLVDSTFVDDPDHEFRSSITGEVTGTGYTAGGVALTTVAFAYDDTNDQVVMTFDPADFGPAEITEVAGIVVYVDTSDPATDVLVGCDVWEPVEADGLTDLVYEHAEDGFIVALRGG